MSFFLCPRSKSSASAPKPKFNGDPWSNCQTEQYRAAEPDERFDWGSYYARQQAKQQAKDLAKEQKQEFSEKQKIGREGRKTVVARLRGKDSKKILGGVLGKLFRNGRN